MKKINPFELSFDELKYLLLTVIILGFCFSFRDWGEGALFFYVGIRNFILITLLTGISILAHEIVHRWFASRYQATIKFKTWKLLLLAALVSTILTNGVIVFSAIWTITITTQYMLRPGFKPPHLSPYEAAKIAVSGPLINALLAIISAYFFFSSGSFVWEKLLTINIWLAAFNLFPFFRVISALLIGRVRTVRNISYKISKGAYSERTELPFMEGEWVFYGSKPLWIFSFSFVVVVAILLNLTKMILLSVVAAFLLAFSLFLIWQYFVEPWSKVYARLAKKIY